MQYTNLTESSTKFIECKCDNKYILRGVLKTCADMYNCCDCGGVGCSCKYCFRCNACDNCFNDEENKQ